MKYEGFYENKWHCFTSSRIMQPITPESIGILAWPECRAVEYNATVLYFHLIFLIMCFYAILQTVEDAFLYMGEILFFSPDIHLVDAINNKR